MRKAPAVTLCVPGALRDCCAGVAELPLAAHTVRELLDALACAQPLLHRNVCDETGAVRRHLNVFVNAEHMRYLDGLDTLLQPGDVVTILPAVSGG